MDCDLQNLYILNSPMEKINEFISQNKETCEIIYEIKPSLEKYFPDSKLSLELCDDLAWTTEEKLLLKVSVTDETFFNDILDYFCEIYERIGYLIEDIICPIVLFPVLSNENYDARKHNGVIDLVVRTAYFNGDFDKNFQREMTLREIPKCQQEKEIIEYCTNNPNPDISDIVYDLQLDLFAADEIIDELEDKGFILNVKYD